MSSGAAFRKTESAAQMTLHYGRCMDVEEGDIVVDRTLIECVTTTNPKSLGYTVLGTHG